MNISRFMELADLETIKDIYGWICVGLFVLWGGGILVGNRPGTTQRLLAMGIVGWSGYISLTSDAESIDFLIDWMITVPLIFLSLSYKGMAEGWRMNTLALGFVSIAAILLAGDLAEGEGQLTGLDLDYSLLLTITFVVWFALFVRGIQPFTMPRSQMKASGESSDFEEFSMVEKITYILLLAYPILFFLAGSTVNDITAYEGSMLDDWGLHFYSYITILILLSVVCKIALSIYHVMNDPEGGLTERSSF